MTDSIRLTLPWPPTVNHYWGQRGKGRFVKQEGMAFRAAVVAAWYSERRQGFGRARLRVQVTAYPPDRRRRDLDNLGKAILDALAHARVYEDDSQVDDYRVLRAAQRRPGQILVEVWRL